jgi:hypothetical protein
MDGTDKQVASVPSAGESSVNRVKATGARLKELAAAASAALAAGNMAAYFETQKRWGEVFGEFTLAMQEATSFIVTNVSTWL